MQTRLKHITSLLPGQTITEMSVTKSGEPKIWFTRCRHGSNLLHKTTHQHKKNAELSPVQTQEAIANYLLVSPIREYSLHVMGNFLGLYIIPLLRHGPIKWPWKQNFVVQPGEETPSFIKIQYSDY